MTRRIKNRERKTCKGKKTMQGKSMLFALLLLPFVGFSQTKPWLWPSTAATASDEIYCTHGGGTGHRIAFLSARSYFAPDARTSAYAYEPSISTPPLADRNSIGRSPSGKVYFIDAAGDALVISEPVPTWQSRTVVATVGSATVSLVGSVPTDPTKIKFNKNGLNYKVGSPGCTDCNVVKTGASTFVFFTSAANYDKFYAEVLE